MGQRHYWKTDSRSPCQDITHLKWTSVVHYQLLDPILNHLNPVSSKIFQFFKIHLDVTLTSTPVSPKYLFRPGFRQ